LFLLANWQKITTIKVFLVVRVYFVKKTSIPANTCIDIFEIPVLYQPRYCIFNTELETLARMKEVDDMVVTLEAMINCVLDSHASYKLVTMKSAFKKGLSQETKDVMKERNRVHRQMSKLSGDQKFQVHLQYR
jgi:hypothetical protein